MAFQLAVSVQLLLLNLYSSVQDLVTHSQIKKKERKKMARTNIAANVHVGEQYLMDNKSQCDQQEGRRFRVTSKVFFTRAFKN